VSLQEDTCQTRIRPVSDLLAQFNSAILCLLSRAEFRNAAGQGRYFDAHLDPAFALLLMIRCSVYLELESPEREPGLFLLSRPFQFTPSFGRMDYSMQYTDSSFSLVGKRLMSLSEAAMDRLFPEDSCLEVNEASRILILVSTQSPRILALQQFTRNEWIVLSALFKCYPCYVSHEMLLASLTSLSITECRQRLQEARKIRPQAVKRELKPVHRALCGVRTKLNKLCPWLKISLIRNAGYALTSAP